MCLLLFGMFVICGIVCLSNEYLCLPTKYFFATVFSQIMHFRRDSFKIALWHLSHITLSWCNILFSCIWVASKLFPYSVMSKIYFYLICICSKDIFSVWYFVIYIWHQQAFFQPTMIYHIFTDKFLCCGNNKAVWQCIIYYSIVRIVPWCLMMHWDLGKSGLW